jgi:purine nucleosidase
MSHDRRRVLLDTDIGSDIDDALCLSYLLRQPRCELMGVTTVSGRDPRVRAALVDAMCRCEDRGDIPIHSGAGTAFLGGQVTQPEVPQAEVLSLYDHRPVASFPANTAVAFLQQTINDHPGEIDLLAIGPMTNIALLFAMDPGVIGRLRSLMLMCGVFTTHTPGAATPAHREWNALCDPEATQVVYRSHPQRHVSVGLDVTMQVKKPTSVVMQRCAQGGGALTMVADMAKIWSQHVTDVVFHDPLAATLLFQPEICTYRDGLVRIELENRPIAGLTHWDPESRDRPHTIAVGVDARAFFHDYEGTVFHAPSSHGAARS